MEEGRTILKCSPKFGLQFSLIFRGRFRIHPQSSWTVSQRAEVGLRFEKYFYPDLLKHKAA